MWLNRLSVSTVAMRNVIVNMDTHFRFASDLREEKRVTALRGHITDFVHRAGIFAMSDADGRTAIKKLR